MLKNGKKMIFVSHSSKDCEMVNSLINFLVSAFKINFENIYCTSSGSSIHPLVGKDFIEDIRENIKDAKRVFCLISESFLKSYFCLCELGAAWAFKSNIVLIIVPPLTPKILDSTPLKTLKAITLESWNEIYSDLNKAGIVDEIKISQHQMVDQQFQEVRNCAYNLSNNGLNNVRYEVYSYGFNDLAITSHDVLVDGEHCGKVIIDLNGKKQIDDNAFCSYVAHFFPFKDWSNEITNDTLRFQIKSSNISAITLELKCTNMKTIVHQQSINLSENDWILEKVPLNPIRIKWRNYLTEVSEICFVVNPQNVVGNVGELYLRNVSLGV